MGYSFFAAFTNSRSSSKILFPHTDFRFATLNMNMIWPIIREALLIRGFISANKSSIIRALNGQSKTQSKAVAIVTGGAAEALYAIPGKNTILLSNRKGFIKLALQTGSNLVPVYSFGENNLYKQVTNPAIRRIQMFLTEKLTFAPVLCYGRWGTLVPFQAACHVVVGTPIPVKRTPDPSNAQIDSLHAAYVDQLTELFNQYKQKYDPDGEELVVL